MSEAWATFYLGRAAAKYGCPCKVIPWSTGCFAVLVLRDKLPGRCPADRFTITNIGQAKRYLG